MPVDLRDEPGWLRSESERRKRVLKNRRQREHYGPGHKRRREQLERRMQRGEEFTCPRCNLPIVDTPWDLGHDDLDPRIERPEHSGCNRGAPHRNLTSRDW